MFNKIIAHVPKAAWYVFIAIIVVTAGPRLCQLGESFFHWLGGAIPGGK